jgi:nucleotide-binding universal stress UspA family protein
MPDAYMPEFSDDALVEFALGLRDDRAIREAVARSPDLHSRLRNLESELRSLEQGVDELLAEAASASALPSADWRILLCIDDSPVARRAAATAGMLARLAGGEVEVLHVVTVWYSKAGSVSTESKREAVALVDSFVTRLRDDGVCALGQIRRAGEGRVARHILDEAEAQQATLVVMGLGAFSGIGALLRESVSRGVLRRAPCPVMIIR